MYHFKFKLTPVTIIERMFYTFVTKMVLYHAGVLIWKLEFQISFRIRKYVSKPRVLYLLA